jgi:hypothetical protein
MALPDQLTEIAGVIAEQFGELCPVTVTYLGEGYDSTAFDVNGRWVFRFPKRCDVERQLLLESEILPLLAPRIPYRYRASPSTGCHRSDFHGILWAIPGLRAFPASAWTRSTFG